MLLNFTVLLHFMQKRLFNVKQQQIMCAFICCSGFVTIKSPSILSLV